MENYENEELHQEHACTEPQTPEAPQQPEPRIEQPYNGADAGRRESPFADSPYVMNHQSNAGGEYQPRGGYIPPFSSQEPPRQKLKKQGRGKVWKTVLASILTVALVAGGCGITAWMVNDHWAARTAAMTQSFNEQIAGLQAQINTGSGTSNGNSVPGTPMTVGTGLTPSQVYAQNVNSVVAISCRLTTNYFGQVTESASSGSGFILTADGYVVTNYHVVEGATNVNVITHDGAEYAAQLIGFDVNNDIAILKVEDKRWKTAKVF